VIYRHDLSKCVDRIRRDVFLGCLCNWA